MEEKMGLTWQIIDQQQTNPPQTNAPHTFLKTERAKIPGGWLVRTAFYLSQMNQPQGGSVDLDISSNVSITFVPDSAGWN
jgi:hypothetical protein